MRGDCVRPAGHRGRPDVLAHAEKVRGHLLCCRPNVLPRVCAGLHPSQHDVLHGRSQRILFGRRGVLPNRLFSCRIDVLWGLVLLPHAAVLPGVQRGVLL